MKIYTLYIEDDRYSVPTLLSVERADDSVVIAYASALLVTSSHYLAIETWDGDRWVSRLVSPAAGSLSPDLAGS